MTTEDTHPVIPGFGAPARRWLYGVSIAAILLAIAFDLVSASTAALIAPLLVAVLHVSDPPTSNVTQPGLFDNNAYGDTGGTGR